MNANPKRGPARLDTIRAIEGATPGEWIAVRDPSHFDTLSEIKGGKRLDRWPYQEFTASVGGAGMVAAQEANTRHIAATSPAAMADILAYVDELDKARQDIM